MPRKRKVEFESEPESPVPPKSTSTSAAAPRPQTLRQVKAAYKKTSSRLSEKELRQIQRRAELEARAAKIRAAEKRRESNKRKREEKKERELRNRDSKAVIDADELGKFFGRAAGKENVPPPPPPPPDAAVASAAKEVKKEAREEEEENRRMSEEKTGMKTVYTSLVMGPSAVLDGDEYGDWDIPSNSQVEREISGVCTPPTLERIPTPARPALAPARSGFSPSPSPSPLSLHASRPTEVNDPAHPPSAKAHALARLTTNGATPRSTTVKTTLMPPPPRPGVRAGAGAAKAQSLVAPAQAPVRRPLPVPIPVPAKPTPARAMASSLANPKPPSIMTVTKSTMISSLTSSQQQIFSSIPLPSTQDIELTDQDLKEICGPSFTNK